MVHFPNVLPTLRFVFPRKKKALILHLMCRSVSLNETFRYIKCNDSKHTLSSAQRYDILFPAIFGLGDMGQVFGRQHTHFLFETETKITWIGKANIIG